MAKDKEKAGPPVQNAAELGDQEQLTSRPQVPEQLLQHADAVASTTAAETTGFRNSEPFPPLEDVPPPPYDAVNYGEIDLNQNGFDSGARVAEDGRVDIKIDQINRRLTNILTRQLTNQLPPPQLEPSIPEGLKTASGLPCPPLNLVIQVVGSRGDVQPFIALGQVLKNKYNHRVRLATHPVFRDFVTENGLEFFSIGGDPAELMAFMVKNPGLVPGIETLKSGDIGKKRKGIYEMVNGCWRSCIEAGDGSGPPASDSTIDDRSSIDSAISLNEAVERPFIADAIIANPPSFAHVHIAEKLGIPLHLMFTMPWSPTQAYPHPLANILSSNTDQGMTNFMSYVLVDMLTWQGIGDVINRFREKALQLDPISIIWAPGSLHRLRIPWTYAWSPALIPKPSDWSSFIDIAGFYFLDLATNYTPPGDLAEFLSAGSPPVYIGFGSIVVEDPNAMTKLIFEAVKMTGCRALVSKGWGGLDAGELGQPDDVFMLGNCPHDWLFQRVSAVVHHGGAGTTAAGIKAGKPTVIVPFFGDQPFWGNMIHQAGAGPKPIPSKSLTAQNLANAIKQALEPKALEKAKDISIKIEKENGPEDGAESFHKFLGVPNMRCNVAPGRAAVWRVKRTNIRLSALAATVLASEGLIDFSDLKLYRPREYEVDTGPPEPLSGGAAAIVGTVGSMAASVADFPSEVLKSFKTASGESAKRQSTRSMGESTPTASSLDLGESVVQPRSPIASVTDISSPSTYQSRSIFDDHDDRERGRSGTVTPATTTMDIHDTRSSLASLSTFRSESKQRNGESQRRSCSSQEVGRITLDSAVGSAKAAGNIVGIALKSPLDFTMSLAKGFHNLPRLYNDTTVRPQEKVTGFQSGLKAAGKTFAYGFMDGIGGVVTQPVQGFMEEGGSGFVKGLVKGSFGLVVKPSAAIWGLQAYAMQGIYAEISKKFGRSSTNYIIAARIAQGYGDFKSSSEGERDRILATWRTPELEQAYESKKYAKHRAEPADTNKAGRAERKDRLVDENGNLISGFRNTMRLSFEERKELARRKKAQHEQLSHDGSDTVGQGLSKTTDDEFRSAIREAVQRTSTNDSKQDQAIENAIWASVRELQRTDPDNRVQAVADAGNDKNEDTYQRAIAASVAEYKRSQGQPSKSADQNAQESGSISTKPGADNDYDGDAELMRALTASLEEYTSGIQDEASRNATSPPDDDSNDEEMKRAIQESLESHASNSKGEPNSSSAVGQSSRDTHSQEILEANADPEDAQLQEALRLSRLESDKHSSELAKQQTEEEIVMEYVMKQSLAEENYRKQRTGGQSN